MKLESINIYQNTYIIPRFQFLKRVEKCAKLEFTSQLFQKLTTCCELIVQSKSLETFLVQKKKKKCKCSHHQVQHVHLAAFLKHE